MLSPILLCFSKLLAVSPPLQLGKSFPIAWRITSLIALCFKHQWDLKGAQTVLIWLHVEIFDFCLVYSDVLFRRNVLMFIILAQMKRYHIIIVIRHFSLSHFVDQRSALASGQFVCCGLKKLKLCETPEACSKYEKTRKTTVKCCHAGLVSWAHPC